MNILVIDTSNQVMGAALVKDKTVMAELLTNVKKNHSIQLMPAIDQLMKQTNMKPDMLDKIIVAKGPGSFTGIRIGLSTAKTLAWALDIPVKAVSSLAVLAYQAHSSNRLICPFFDARRSNVYSGIYSFHHNELKLEVKEQNLPMADWLSELAAKKQEIVFLSPDIALYKDMIKEYMGDLAIIPDEPFQMIRPSHAVLAGAGEDDPVHSLVPNYLRLAEAEAKWLKLQKEQAKDD